MPQTFKTPEEARNDLLEKTRSWRASFTALAGSKTKEMKEMATTLTGVVDSMAAQQSFVFTAQAQQEGEIQSLVSGMDLIARTNDTISEQMTKETEEREKLEKIVRNMEKTVDANERRSRTNLTTSQRMQLDRSQTSIIVRNVRQDVRPETYPDTLRAFEKVTRHLRLNNIRVNYIRRLPAARGDRRQEPPALRVELSCLGDKIMIFSVMEKMIQDRVKIIYPISNEIPNYAMNGFKYLSRVATEVRRSDPDLKTRVLIARGDIMPTIVIRQRNETNYKKIPDVLLDTAKAEIQRQNKADAERRRRDREEALLREEPMDIGANAGKTNTTPNPFQQLFKRT